ncbi:MAG: cytochrome c family protein [Flavobacteriaceae bacterium]|nr:cytochrome c family protein [Flavobacteriaceae bacterium]|tara:strand:+ start:412 stop:1422 length:1011 start_codon:yes stop_codon:yes gene_type:complete
MKYIALILLSVFVLSCNNSKNKDLSAFEKNMQANNHPGKKLMETNCYVCHSPTASHDNRIGPPMVAIKKHYIDNETTKEQFIADMKAWIKNPNEADAKMRGAVRRFGVMPMQAFPEETIEKIADYMYDFEIDQPEWFEDHFNEEKGKHNGNGQGKGMGQGKGKHQQQAQTSYEDLPYGERGLKYALTTKAVLGKNLMGTIQKKGTLEALEFCNVRAYPLTDSMAVVHNASIKRVSDKPRNQKNKANNEELEYIETFKNLLSEKKEINPIVKESDNDVHVYYPIITNTMCLQCHGKIETNIKPDILKSLTLLYPEDRAKGYSENQVRGMWNVSFKKN